MRLLLRSRATLQAHFFVFSEKSICAAGVPFGVMEGNTGDRRWTPKTLRRRVIVLGAQQGWLAKIIGFYHPAFNPSLEANVVPPVAFSHFMLSGMRDHRYHGDLCEQPD